MNATPLCGDEDPGTVEYLVRAAQARAAEDGRAVLALVENLTSIREELEEDFGIELPVGEPYAVEYYGETEVDVCGFEPKRDCTVVQGVQDARLRDNVKDFFVDCATDDVVIDAYMALDKYYEGGTEVFVTVTVVVDPRTNESTLVVFARVQELDLE